MTWMCDRCNEVVKPASRKNQRPIGWVTVRLTKAGEYEAQQWMLCAACQEFFYAAMKVEANP